MPPFLQEKNNERLNMSTRLILAFTLCIQSIFALAANDLDKWNSPESKELRAWMKTKTSATTTYKEMPNSVDASYRSTSNGGKVLQQIEHVSTKEGSKIGTTIEALKVPNKSAVAKKWANELFKGGVRFTAGAVLIEVAMQEMLDGIGWIIDEGAKIQRPVEHDPNDEAYAKYTSPYMWKGTHSQYKGGYNYSLENACRNYLAFLLKESGGSSGDTYVKSSGNTCYYITAKRYEWTTTLSRATNPNYNPSAVPPAYEEVTQPEAQQKIADYLNNSPNSSKDLLIEEAYKPTGKGYIEWSDDPDSRKEIFGDDPNLAKKVYESDNPVADGLTKSTPQIKDSTVIEGETTPNPNPEPPTIPDPVTGQPIPNPNYNPNLDTGSKTETKLPPACEYFAKLCAWLDWTQEDPPENDNEEPQAPSDQGIFDWSFNTDFNLGGQCPGDLSFTWTGKYFAGTHTISLQWLCLIFTFLGYPLVFLSHCIGVWIFYEVASRKELKSGY